MPTPQVYHSNQNETNDPSRNNDCEDDNEELFSQQLLKPLIALMVPSAFSSMLNFGMQALTVSFVGRRLGATALGHLTVSLSAFNLFGLSLGMGLVSTLDTLVSQAYGRCQQRGPDVGELFQRANLVTLVLCIPITILFCFGRSFFVFAFGDDLGSAAALFLSRSLPWFLLNCVNGAMTSTLQAINLPHLNMVSLSASALLGWFLNYWLIKDSFLDVSFTMALAQLAQSICMIAVALVHPSVTFYKHCQWPSPHLLNWPQTKAYLVVAIPALVSVLAEWWVFEMVQVVAANISIETVELYGLFLEIILVLYAIQGSVGDATAVCVGNALGENRPVLAKRYAKFGFIINQIVNAVDVCVLLLFPNVLAVMFTTDTSLQQSFVDITACVCIFHWLDSTQNLLQGVFRGAGKQADAVRAVLPALWFIGLPAATLFGYVYHGGTKGILQGMMCGFSLEIPLMFYSLYYWNWDELAKRASEELHKDGDGVYEEIA